MADGPDVAAIGLGIPGQVAQGLSARAYIYTDRPAYRPGQAVALRGVVREAKDGQYADPAGETYRLEVLDSRGRLLVARPVTLSEFGTFHEAIGLDSSAPVGAYRVRLFQPGKSEFAGGFQVESYRLEKVDVSIDLPRTVYFRGETIAADVVARYQYGAPLVNKPVDVVFSGGLRKAGRTDAAGKFHVEFPTGEFAEEQALQIRATLVDENVAAVADVALAIHALQIRLSTTRDTYLDGESFALKVAASDALGKPAGQSLTVAVVKRIVRNGEVSERQVSGQAIVTDAKTGEFAARVKVDDADGGPYVLRVSGKDRFGNAIVADRVLTISGATDEAQAPAPGRPADVQGRRDGAGEAAQPRPRRARADRVGGRPGDPVPDRRPQGGGQSADVGRRGAVQFPQLHAHEKPHADVAAAVRRGADGRPRRARPAGLGDAEAADGRAERGGGGRGDDGRPARQACRGRTVAVAGRSLTAAAVR